MTYPNYEALLRDRQSYGLDPIKVAADWLRAKDRIADRIEEELNKYLHAKRKANGR